jgi:hypothetical protein
MSALARNLLVLAVVLLVAYPARSAPTEEEIARAVRQLGDNDFAVREKAVAFLLAAGQAAKPAVRQALKSDDPDASLRWTKPDKSAGGRSLVGGFPGTIGLPTAPSRVAAAITLTCGGSC